MRRGDDVDGADAGDARTEEGPPLRAPVGVLVDVRQDEAGEHEEERHGLAHVDGPYGVREIRGRSGMAKDDQGCGEEAQRSQCGQRLRPGRRLRSCRRGCPRVEIGCLLETVGDLEQARLVEMVRLQLQADRQPFLEKPPGIEIAGVPVRLPAIVKMSLRYICTGSSAFDPSSKAARGRVGPSMTSQRENARWKSSAIRRRTCWALR